MSKLELIDGGASDRADPLAGLEVIVDPEILRRFEEAEALGNRSPDSLEVLAQTLPVFVEFRAHLVERTRAALAVVEARQRATIGASGSTDLELASLARRHRIALDKHERGLAIARDGLRQLRERLGPGGGAE